MEYPMITIWPALKGGEISWGKLLLKLFLLSTASQIFQFQKLTQLQN